MKKLIAKIQSIITYCMSGVWEDPRSTLGVRLIKTINLVIGSFSNRSLQIKSMALTYNTVLAIVPAFALLFAIGRGFGMQGLLESSLYTYLPSQTKAIATAMTFVDSYLKEASQGVFVGVGIVLLLWTIVSLLSYIEDAFNSIWGIKQDRSFYQKITDYISICLMVPVLMICSSGLSIFMATKVQEHLHLPFLTPIIDTCLEAAPVVLVWLAFSLSFWLIPNTKVNFKYAAISGAICAISFQILQMLFVNGQIYVSKYNAIYGSFAFLPLLLVWLQFSWLILLSGCVLTYSLQNVFTYEFLDNVSVISPNYYRKVEVVVMAVIIDRFVKHATPPTVTDISNSYDIPIRLANRICDRLVKGKLIYRVMPESETKGVLPGLTPAIDVNTFSVSDLLDTMNEIGRKNFIPRFNVLYNTTLRSLDRILESAYPDGRNILLKDLSIPSPKGSPS